jgi:dephospho-CoA kinase
MIIGITGTNGAGKDLVSQILLKKLGWPYFSLSDELRRIALENNLDVSRPTLQKLGDELRQQHGPSYLSQRIVNRAADDFVVISLRNPYECEPFKQKSKFILIAVDAPVELRYERIAGRDRAGESNWSLADFKRNEEEFEMNGGEYGRQLGKMIQMADIVVINDGTIADLENKVNQIIREVTNVS